MTKRHFPDFLALSVAVPLSLAALPVSADPLTIETINELFADAEIVSGPEIVDCILSGGAESACFQITIQPVPNYTPGPWCPTSIDDGPDQSGIWFYNGDAVDLDGEFIQSLAAIYDDDRWQVFDAETGEVFVTDTQLACESAARPDVDERYQNHCVECALEYYPETTMTYTIPLEPVAADAPEEVGFAGAGVAFNGIRIDGPAPIQAILSSYTIAALDDCGGHVNPHVGYHYHVVSEDCIMGEHGADHDDAPHVAVVGIALDGFMITSHLNADGSTPEGLDACYGHETEDLGYHYHAGAPGSNQNLGCFTAQIGCSSEFGPEMCDAPNAPKGPPLPPAE